MNIPERLTDSYFKRKVLKKPKHAEGEIFDNKKEVCCQVFPYYLFQFSTNVFNSLQEYEVSAERKADQIDVDTQLLKVIRSHPDKKFLIGYLSTFFSIKTGEYPHKMLF